MRLTALPGTYRLSESVDVTPFVRTYDATTEDETAVYNYIELYYSKIHPAAVAPSLEALDEYRQLLHPSIVSVREVVHNESKKIVGILTERISDITLRQLINDFIDHRTKMQEDQIWAIVSQLVRAIQYFHMTYKPNRQNLRRVIHKCLHPDNIFVSNTGVVRIGLPELSYMIGCIRVHDLSPRIQGYMAPEIIADETVSDKSDIWSLGVIFYELCTLTPLLPLVHGSNFLDIINTLRSHISIPGYSFDLCEVINGMLRREPLHRFSAYELLHHRCVQKALANYQLPDLFSGSEIHQMNAQTTMHSSLHSSQGRSAVQFSTTNTPLPSGYIRNEEVETKKAFINRLQNSRYKPEKFDATVRTYYGVDESSAGPDRNTTYRGTDVLATGKPYQLINFELKNKELCEQSFSDNRRRLARNELNLSINDTSYTSTASTMYNSVVQSTAKTEVCTPTESFHDMTDSGYSMTESKGTKSARGRGKSRTRTGSTAKVKRSKSCAVSELSTALEQPTEFEQPPPDDLAKSITKYTKSSRSNAKKAINTDNGVVSMTMTSALAQSLQDPDTDSRVQQPITNTDYKPSAKLDCNLDVWVDDIVINVLQKTHGYYTMDDIKNRLFEIVPGMQLNPGVSVHSPSDLISIQILAEEVEKRLEPYKEFFSSSRQKSALQGPGYMQSGVDAVNIGMESNADNVSYASDTVVETDTQQTAQTNGRRVLSSNHPRGRRDTDLPPHERIRRADSTLGTAAAVSAALNLSCTSDFQSRYTATTSFRNRSMTLDDYHEQKSIARNTDSTAWKSTWSRASYSQKVLPSSKACDDAQYTCRPIDYTNLMKAATLGDLDNVKLLISLEANITTRHGVTALMLAASAGHIAIIEALIPYESKKVDKDGLPSLSYAVKSGHMEACKILAPLEAGIIANNGLSPLMIACDYDQVSIAFILKEYGSRLQTKTGATALMRSAQKNNYPLCKTLLTSEAAMQNNAGETAMFIAAKNNFLQIVELLEEPEHRIANEHGVTALMVAASRNYVDIVRLLHQKECDMRDMYDETALMKAAKAGALDSAAVLLEREGGMAREDGKTAMMYAAEAGQLEMVDMLLHKECARAMKDGTTALMLAAQRGQHHIIRMLARFEAKRQRISGETALMLAIRYGNVDAVYELINYEGDIQMYNGTTIEEVAKLTGNLVVIQAVKERFGKVGTPDASIRQVAGSHDSPLVL